MNGPTQLKIPVAYEVPTCATDVTPWNKNVPNISHTRTHNLYLYILHVVELLDINTIQGFGRRNPQGSSSIPTLMQIRTHSLFLSKPQPIINVLEACLPWRLSMASACEWSSSRSSLPSSPSPRSLLPYILWWQALPWNTATTPGSRSFVW